MAPESREDGTYPHNSTNDQCFYKSSALCQGLFRMPGKCWRISKMDALLNLAHVLLGRERVFLNQ